MLNTAGGRTGRGSACAEAAVVTGAVEALQRELGDVPSNEAQRLRTQIETAVRGAHGSAAPPPRRTLVRRRDVNKLLATNSAEPASHSVTLSPMTDTGPSGIAAATNSTV